MLLHEPDKNQITSLLSHLSATQPEARYKETGWYSKKSENSC